MNANNCMFRCTEFIYPSYKKSGVEILLPGQKLGINHKPLDTQL